MDARFEEGAICFFDYTINNMNIILLFKEWVLLFVELSGILTWVVDAEESMWLCLLLLAAKFLFLQICIMNLVVFVALKLTLMASKNIIEIHRACIWLNSLTIFTKDPV